MFIKSFSRYAAPLISILQTTSYKELGIQTSKNEKNHNTQGDDSNNIGGSNENLSTITNLTKSKKSNLVKSKK